VGTLTCKLETWNLSNAGGVNDTLTHWHPRHPPFFFWTLKLLWVQTTARAEGK
jgi:hypothetical protein